MLSAVREHERIETCHRSHNRALKPRLRIRCDGDGWQPLRILKRDEVKLNRFGIPKRLGKPSPRIFGSELLRRSKLASSPGQ